jgi:uncharacterized membrane protein
VTRVLSLPRWLVSLVLIASLGGNLFLAGIVFGRHFAPRPPPPDPEVMFGRMIDHLSASLTPSDRDTLQRVFAAHRGQFADHAAAVRQARVAVERAMAAEPFRRDELRAAFERMEAERLAMAGTFRDALVETAADISPQGRQVLARRPPLRP